MAFLDEDKIESALVTLAGNNSGISGKSPTISTWCDENIAISSKMLMFRSVTDPMLRDAAGVPISWKASCTARVLSSADDDKDGSKANALQASVASFIAGIDKSSLSTTLGETVDHISVNAVNSSLEEGMHIREIVFDIFYN